MKKEEMPYIDFSDIYWAQNFIKISIKYYKSGKYKQIVRKDVEWIKKIERRDFIAILLQDMPEGKKGIKLQSTVYYPSTLENCTKWDIKKFQEKESKDVIKEEFQGTTILLMLYTKYYDIDDIVNLWNGQPCFTKVEYF